MQILKWKSARAAMIGALVLALFGAKAVADDETTTAAAVRQAKSLSMAFRAAAKKVIPAVVEVQTRHRPRGGMFHLPMDEINGQDPRAREMALGSGVILDPKGIVLTNNHVVHETSELVVVLASGRSYDVEDVLIDEKTDLAVLLLKTDEEVPHATLGDSESLDIGDWVLAIGSPFDLDLSVSAGIVSAKGRSLGPTQRANFIQTDAAINPGNSGGPLVNIDGEVVGINTAIASRSGGYQGIGFAIPSSMAQWVVGQLLEYGEVRRAYLGVSISPMTLDDAKRLGVSAGSGVVVQRLFEDSPAEKAGLRRDDVILTFDGRPIDSANQLQAVVEVSDVDGEHEMLVIRDGRKMTLPVELETMPQEFGREPNLLGDAPAYYRDPMLGLLLVELNDRLADRFGFAETEGILVVDVSRGGPAAEAGLRPGVVIVEIGKEKIASMTEYEEAMSEQSLERGVRFGLLTREGKRTSITITVR